MTHKSKATIVRIINPGPKAKSLAQFRVGLNVFLQGSNQMSPEVQSQLLQETYARVIIVAEDEDLAAELDALLQGHTVMVNEVANATEFKPNADGKKNVGYKLHGRGYRWHVHGEDDSTTEDEGAGDTTAD